MNNKYKLEVNEQVQLVSGGAIMILKEFKEENQQQAICMWMSEAGELHERSFDLDILVPADRTKRMMIDLELTEFLGEH